MPGMLVRLRVNARMYELDARHVYRTPPKAPVKVVDPKLKVSGVREFRIRGKKENAFAVCARVHARNCANMFAQHAHKRSTLPSPLGRLRRNIYRGEEEEGDARQEIQHQCDCTVAAI